MDLKMLLENFEVIAEAENGIQRLRELILDLAIRGKLVPQYDSEEPLSLEKVQEELKALSIGRKKQKTKTPFQLGESEIPFDKPKSWQWCQLGEIIQISSGNYLPLSKMDKSGNIPVYGSNGNIGYHTEANIFKQTLVIGRVGSCGSVHLTPDIAWVTDNAFITYFSEQSIDINFLYWLLKGRNLQQYNNATAQPVISGRKIYPIPIALPPLEEQKRIVSKIDELMELCDRAEARKKNRNKLQQQLRRSAIHALETAETEEDFKKSWHFVRDNFWVIAEAENGIQQLQKLILVLAVRGMLVSQNTEEESAQFLLEQLKANKEQLSMQKNKKGKSVSEITDDEIPFNFPKGWIFVKLGNLFHIVRGSSPRPKGDPRYFATKPTPFHWIKIADITAYTQDGCLMNTDEYLTEEGINYSRKVDTDDIIIAASGSVGKACRLGIEGFIYDGLMAVKGIKSKTIQSFLLLYFKTIELSLLNEATGTSWKNINTDILQETVIPLPPLEEQKRIVSKVDELMKCCDRVEENLSKKEELASAISASIIHHLEL